MNTRVQRSAVRVVSLLGAMVLVLGLGSGAMADTSTPAPSDDTTQTSQSPTPGVTDTPSLPASTPEETTPVTDDPSESEAPSPTPDGETTPPAEKTPGGVDQTVVPSPPEVDADVTIESLGGDSYVTPFGVGPDGANPPYLYWTVKDEDASPVASASFQLRGPRDGSYFNSSWGSQITVDDCVGLPCNGPDKDPDAGEFLVTHINGNAVVSGKAYGIRQSAAPDGYSFRQANDWKEIPNSYDGTFSGSWSANSGEWVSGTHGFGNFPVYQPSDTITVKKGDVRTGTGSSNIASTYAVGARFGLFASDTAQNPVNQDWAICEITNATEGCVFEVPYSGSDVRYWVGELEPVADSPAAENYTTNIARLSAGGQERPYRYRTPWLEGDGDSYEIPQDHSTSGDWSSSSGRFLNRLSNPELDLKCKPAGVNVAIVMDLSASVYSSRSTLNAAAKGFVSALEGTESAVGLFSFGTSAPRSGQTDISTPLSVQSSANVQTLRDRIDSFTGSIPSNGQGTNWDGGLWNAAQHAEKYDLVLVLTDGNPTYSNSSSGVAGPGDSTYFRELERAIASANAIKDEGTRVLTVGIGSGLSDYNLSSISGPTKYTSGLTLNEVDYTSTNWADLKALLEDFAVGLSCEATVDVKKLEQQGTANPVPGEGWEFTVGSSSASVSVLPQEAGETNGQGLADWTLKFTDYGLKSNVTITEIPQPGWNLDGVSCTVNSVNRPVTVASGAVTIENVGVGDKVACTYTNKKVPTASLQLVKEVNNTFNGTAAPTNWDLVATAHDGGAAHTFVSGDAAKTVTPGTYDLSEAARAGTPAAVGGYFWDSLQCSVGGAAPVSVSLDNPIVTLGEGTATVCTFTNKDKPGTLTWEKVTDGEPSVHLAGSEWLLVGPNSYSQPIVDNGPLDADGADGKFRIEGLAWGNYTLTETKAPPGYVAVQDAVYEVAIGASDTMEFGFGSIKNERLPGSVTWLKVDGSQTLLAGSEWTLTGPDIATEGVPVVDCIQATCAEGPFTDQDPEPGKFKLENLEWGDYTLTESKAPAGYIPSDTVYSFTVSGETLNAVVNGGDPIVNVQQTVPNLPLTGGLGRDHVMILGGGLLLAALALGGWHFRGRWART